MLSKSGARTMLQSLSPREWLTYNHHADEKGHVGLQVGVNRWLLLDWLPLDLGIFLVGDQDFCDPSSRG